MSSKKEYVIEFETVASREELDETWESLLSHAEQATRATYAPYSNYHVGAALLLENGEIVLGSNQENAAYPSGLCAERVAFFAASANHPAKTIKRVAVVARKGDSIELLQAGPCGSCRQVMLEYELKQKQSIEILMADENGGYIISSSISNLLPISFNRDNLV